MKQILACIDGSRSASSVCDYAAWAAVRLQAPLTLLHVLDPHRYPRETDLSGNLELGAREHLLQELAELDARRNRLALEQGQHMLDAACERVRAHGIDNPVQRQRHGLLAEAAVELEADTGLLVMGKAGESHADELAMGDNVEQVIRALHCPILLAAGEFRPPQHVMLAFDNRESSRAGVQLLADSPLFRDLRCHLVTVSDRADDLKGDLSRARQTLEQSGHRVDVAVLTGDIEPALHEYQHSHQVDMVVMGAYGHSRLREWLLGSTTNDMIRHARVPHLLLR